MGIFDRSSLNDGVLPREVFGWAMYDFANSGYTTVVLTAVFSAYFVGVVADNAPWATFAWTVTLAISAVLVMALAPAIGAFGDALGAKKRLLAFATTGCVAATAGLALTQSGTVALAVALIIVSNFFYSIGESLIAAFLPELSRPKDLGKVSGWGWSFGYFGGMLALGLSLAYVLSAKAAGETASQFVPVTMLITAVIYAIAVVPTFLWLRERAQPRPIALVAEELGRPQAVTSGIRASLQRLSQTWHAARQLQDFYRLLLCGTCYHAGISVVITLAAIYAQEAMKFTEVETMTLIFLVNIAAALGAFVFGYAQDRIGHKRALGITLVGWIVMTLLAAFATTRGLFWLAATLAGLCMGSSQSAGRAMIGVLAPAQRVGEFYGIWNMAVRLASIIGPVTYGAITWASAGNHRMAIFSTAAFFVAGLILLAAVDMRRGHEAALAY